MRHNIPPLSDRLNWARDYKRQLEILRDDIRLLSKKDSKIYIALDFFDFYEHFFPANYLFDPKYSSISNERVDFFKRYHARSALFYLNITSCTKIIN